MSSPLLFSVIIPCHNAGRWIGQALRSVVAQTVPAHEIIVVDDASTDDSVSQIQSSGVPVKLLHVKEHNAAAARNHGIIAATGNWIALLDADDRWYPNHLARATEFLHGSSDIAYRGFCNEIDVQDRIQPVARPQPLTESRRGLTHSIYPALEAGGIYFAHSAMVLHRDSVLAVSGYDPSQRRRHDIDLWLRLIHGRTWCYDAVPTALYRTDTPGSIGRNLASCEYYYLRALLRSRERYAGPEMDQLVHTAAKRAMSLAFMNGTANDVALARELAWPHLPRLFRAAYRSAALIPAPLRLFLRAKRWYFTFRTGHRLETAGRSSNAVIGRPPTRLLPASAPTGAARNTPHTGGAASVERLDPSPALPLVSILIPVYNSARWVKAAIESALAQTYPRCEVLVRDDGSTDDSLAIVKSFASRIRWTSGPNIGANRTRNELLRQCSGEWMQFLDADDYLLPEHVERQVGVAQTSPHADVVYSPFTLELWEDDVKVETKLLPVPEPREPCFLLACWRLPGTHACLFRRDALVRIGGWRHGQPCCQEHEMMLRLIKAGNTFVYASSSGAVYRHWSNGTLSKKNVARTIATRLGIVRDLEEFLTSHGSMTPEVRRAAMQCRLESARTLYANGNEVEASQLAAEASCQFPDCPLPTTPAFPRMYRLAYRVFGFDRAERLATAARSLRRAKRVRRRA